MSFFKFKSLVLFIKTAISFLESGPHSISFPGPTLPLSSGTSPFPLDKDNAGSGSETG